MFDTNWYNEQSKRIEKVRLDLFLLRCQIDPTVNKACINAATVIALGFAIYFRFIKKLIENKCQKLKA